MLKVLNLVKIYKTKKADTVYALNNVSIEFPETGLVFLLGKSGSGKSTLLNAIGGLDKFDSGEIIIKGKSSKDFTQSDFDSYRNTFIGFIFQEYNILENFTVAKNLALALELQGKKARKEEVNALLEQVDMLQYANRKPNQLSGGQKQRVAIARALIKNPEIIMADEPTGALDSNTGKQVMDTLKKLSEKKLVIIVSHDREFAEVYGDRIIELKDGQIISDMTKKEIQSRQTASGIKLIGDDMLYIKKGQQISDSEVYSLSKFIKRNVEKSDLFISFDKEGNKKLKEGAKINDEGNKESFVATTPSDIKQQNYNGNSLKLIKSHLKFSDSFKMGASSLKTKVGKLIFTLLLSFFAFTVFGLIDTFSTWNRATSVYDGIKYDNQKIVVFKKQQREEGNTYMNDMNFSSVDIENLSQKFPDYTFKPVAGSRYRFATMDVVGQELPSQVNYVWQFCATKFANFSNDDLEAGDFEIEGRLPVNDHEIAITKHLFNVLEKNLPDMNLTSFSGLKLTINNFYEDDDSRYEKVQFDVVGIVDDKSDFSKYESLKDSEIQSNYKVANEITSRIMSGISNWVFVSSSNMEKLNKLNGENSTYAYMEINDASNRQNIWGDEVSITFNEWADNLAKEYSNDYNLVKYYNINYFKGGVEKIIGSDGKFVQIGDNEIMVYYGLLENRVSDYKTQIDNDQLYISIYTKPYGGEKIGTYKVIGTLQSNNNNILGGNGFANTYKHYESMSNYNSIYTFMQGTSQDAELIKYCETINSENTRFAVVNGATEVFDSFEDIITSVSTIFLYVAIAFAVFASLLLMNFISTSISYKKREIGVLRALGARGSDIFGIFFNESTIIAFINFVLSATATFVGSMIINRVIIKAIGVSVVLLSFGLRQILLLLAICWGSAFISSLIPSIKISKKRPIDAIQNR